MNPERRCDDAWSYRPEWRLDAVAGRRYNCDRLIDLRQDFKDLVGLILGKVVPHGPLRSSRNDFSSDLIDLFDHGL